MEDTRFQPPKSPINIGKRDGKIYTSPEAYDEDNKRMSFELEKLKLDFQVLKSDTEEIKKEYYSKSEVNKRAIGFIGSFGLAIIYSIIQITEYKSNYESDMRETKSQINDIKIHQTKTDDRQQQFEDGIRSSFLPLEHRITIVEAQRQK